MYCFDILFVKVKMNLNIYLSKNYFLYTPRIIINTKNMI